MPNNDNIFVNQLSVPTGLENANSKEILDYLFANDNRLLTAYTGEFALPKDTQGLIAYFSGGEIIISRTHRYDGRVLAFLDLLHQKNRVIKEPFYSDLGLISNIYKTNDERLGGTTHSRIDYDNQMQKDFVDIIARAALHRQIFQIPVMHKMNTRPHKKTVAHHYVEQKICIYRRAFWVFVCNSIQLHLVRNTL